MNAQAGRDETEGSAPPTPDVDQRRAPGPGGTRDALRVLVVEDLPRVRLLLHELIEESGRCEVVGYAETQDEAVAQYEALQPDAVIVDLNLRQGSGMGVIAALRRDPFVRRPMLIVLTNHALPLIEAACLRAGADHFLDKSHDFHKVRELLERALAAQA